jgi:hypothetical protein
MNIEDFSFGSICIDGVEYRDDLVIEGCQVRLRDKTLSRHLRDAFGHTPLSAAEPIPWNCKKLIVGTGVEGKLPVLPELAEEAVRRGVELVVEPTEGAIEELLTSAPGTANAILHLTC